MKLSTSQFVLLILGVINLFNKTHAQSEGIADVVVQSGRLEQKKFDAPASIYTIDADVIRNSGPQVNLSDALAGAPGVVALNRNNYAQDVQISIRGFGARSAFGIRPDLSQRDLRHDRILAECRATHVVVDGLALVRKA